MANDTGELARELDRARATIAALEAELAETNKGVVALYAELDERANQLREISELKSRFLSYMSHEFRTPLGAMRSMTRLLLDRYDGDLNAEQERQVGFVQAAAEELTQMVDDLLDLAKVEAGRITVAPVWFQLVDLYTALRGMFRPIREVEDVNLVFEDPPDGLSRLYTDNQKLSQILRNFIANALKFTDRGEVRVAAQALDGGQIRFAVTDTGVGIASEHLDLLFREYSQVPSEAGRRLRGTGLGLSVCKRFAELLGGHVGVESTLGAGSTFYVVLPAEMPPGSPA